MPPRRTSSCQSQPSARDRYSAQYRRGLCSAASPQNTKLFSPYCKLPTLASKSNPRWGPLLQLRGSNPAHHQRQPASRHGPGHGDGAPGLRLLPAAFPSTSPRALYTRHWTNSSTNEIKPLTHSKAAEELTPAFSLLTVYFLVKHIIYSSIRQIIIYYRLEILSSFPYFNHIMNPILHMD